MSVTSRRFLYIFNIFNIKKSMDVQYSVHVMSSSLGSTHLNSPAALE
jgi:hypothetical protein